MSQTGAVLPQPAPLLHYSEHLFGCTENTHPPPATATFTLCPLLLQAAPSQLMSPAGASTLALSSLHDPSSSLPWLMAHSEPNCYLRRATPLFRLTLPPLQLFVALMLY